MSDFLIAVFKGTYPYFFIPALIAVAYRIVKRQWTKGETVLLSIFVLCFFLQILQNLLGAYDLYISRRYLMPFAPLMFGWTAWGLVELYQKMPAKWHKAAIFLSCLVIAALIWDGARPTIKSYTNKKKRIERKAVLIASEWIRKDYQGKKYGPSPRYKHFYFSALRPLVITDYPACGYWSGGSSQEPGTMDEKVADYALQEEKVSIPQGMKACYRFSVEDRVFVIYKRER